MPKSTSRAVTVVMKDVEQQSEAIHKRSMISYDSSPRIQKIPQFVSTGANGKEHIQETLNKKSQAWYDSSSLFEAGSKEDERRQDKFHAELLQIRKDVAAEHQRRAKQLAKQHLLFKLRALRAARHLENDNIFADKSSRTYQFTQSKVKRTASDSSLKRHIISKALHQHKSTSHDIAVANQAEKVRHARSRSY